MNSMKEQELCNIQTYENQYHGLNVDGLEKVGFGRNYVTDYYVSGFYPPASAMEKLSDQDHSKIVNNLSGYTTLYFHYPACINNCIFCHYYKEEYKDFKSIELEYTRSMIQELRTLLADKDITISFIYFGGGTPSLFSNESLQLISDELRSGRYKIVENCEIRFEIFPKSYEKDTTIHEKLDILKTLGVTTLILDMQSLDSNTLKAIERNNTSWETLNSTLDLCKKQGFSDFHTTLIVGLPHQRWERFKENLIRLVESKNYTLINLFIIFGKAEDRYYELRARNPEIFPTNKEVDMMIMFGRRYLKAQGYTEGPMYFFYRRIRKMKYNKGIQENHSIGIGAAAQSEVQINDTVYYYFNTPDYRTYTKEIQSKKYSQWRGKELSNKQLLTKKFISSLYNPKEVDVRKFQERFSINVLEFYAGPLAKLKEIGVVEYDDEKVKLTQLGLLRAERVMYFFAEDQVRTTNDLVIKEYSQKVQTKTLDEEIPLGKFSYFPTISEEDKLLIDSIICK